MTALLYFLVAVVAAALSTRAWLLEREEPARLAFLATGWSVAIAYLGFSLSLLPGLHSMRLLYMFAGCFVPAGALWTIDRLFSPDEPVSPIVGRLYAATTFVAILATSTHAGFFADVPRASPVEVVTALLAFATFGLTLTRLYQTWQNATLRVDKTRLSYMLGVTAAAIVFTLLEQLARALGPAVDPTALPLASRGVVLQGAIPPFSVLFTAVTIYFLYHTLVLYRLVDLNEALSRLATLFLSALLLLLVDFITFVWVGTFTDYPFHSTFQIFLGSLVFLAAYDPLRETLSFWSNRMFNQRGQQLAVTLEGLRRNLGTVISAEALAKELLSAFHASGRIPVCSVYVWNQGLDAFACMGTRGHGDQRPLKLVAPLPFTKELAEGTSWYSRATLARRASRGDDEATEILTLMDAMNADLTVPFRAGDLVVGWFNVRDEDWSDGFSADEVQRLADVASTGSVVLSNVEDFKVLEEARRLAALGAMAAGLAHEIRNPLAGVKGAAQYLQGEELPDDAQDMLQVIIHEANRLDTVVSQFLDYARPFEMDLAPDHVNALVSRVLTLVRAQGLPDSVELVEDLSGDLPAFPIDSDKLQQVLLNLLQNALQAMPDGGTLTASTGPGQKRGQPAIEITVSDTGPGIPADDRDQLFVPFFTTKKGGTGLGLPISQRIAQAHGGEIELRSVPGKGATFIVRIPLPQALLTEEVPREPSAEEGLTRAALAPVRP